MSLFKESYAVDRQVMIPLEMLGLPSSSVATSLATAPVKMEGAERGSRPALIAAASESVAASATGADSTATISTSAGAVPVMPIQPHIIVPLQTTSGPSPQPTVVIEHDEPSEPKRLRIADEGWTSDS